jgi:hypothetical protein
MRRDAMPTACYTPPGSQRGAFLKANAPGAEPISLRGDDPPEGGRTLGNQKKKPGQDALTRLSSNGFRVTQLAPIGSE